MLVHYWYHFLVRTKLHCLRSMTSVSTRQAFAVNLTVSLWLTSQDLAQWTLGLLLAVQEVWEECFQNSIVRWSETTKFAAAASQEISTRAVVAGVQNSWVDHIWVGCEVESATSCLFSIAKARPSKSIKTKITIFTSPFESVSHQLGSARSSLIFSLTPHSTTKVGQSAP